MRSCKCGRRERVSHSCRSMLSMTTTHTSMANRATTESARSSHHAGSICRKECRVIRPRRRRSAGSAIARTSSSSQ